MKKFQKYKENLNKYSVFGLEENPFSIAPLFRNFKDLEKCEQEEKLFTIPGQLDREIEILLAMKSRRVLVYGLYGVGKTSLVDFLLYLSHNYHKHFCSRVIITRDNIQRALQEMLYTLGMDIVSEISSRSLWKPLQSVQKWLAEKKYNDLLLSNLVHLMGRFSEQDLKNTKKKTSKTVQATPGGMGGFYNMEEEIEIRKSIQSYVDVLSLRKITEYMEDFLQIVQAVGFKDIFIFIDEADHLEKIDEFIQMLVRSREVLFSQDYTFFIAGSIELARYMESMGTIFDKIILVKPADWSSYTQILENRLKMENPKLKIGEVFTEEALRIIYDTSQGVRKKFLRLAQNTLDRAAIEGSKQIKGEHCDWVVDTTKDEVTSSLKEVEILLLKYLAKQPCTSPSNRDFQKAIQLKRVQLRNNLENLLEQGYLQKEKKGRSTYYSVQASYLPYFRSL